MGKLMVWLNFAVCLMCGALLVAKWIQTGSINPAFLGLTVAWYAVLRVDLHEWRHPQ